MSEATTVEKVELSKKALDILESIKGLEQAERKQLGVEIIKNLTVLELAEWVKSLESEFGVTAAAPVAVAAAGSGGAAAASAAPAAEEKTVFDVIITNAGDKKIQVIKEVRAVTSLGLKEAKDLVETTPGVVKKEVTKEEAEQIKTKLEAAGAKVEIK